MRLGYCVSGTLTLNHAAYNAGKKSTVKIVAIAKPPIIATAIGPKNTLRVSGIIANMAAAAVNTIGLKRRMVDSTIACQAGKPLALSWSI